MVIFLLALGTIVALVLVTFGAAFFSDGIDRRAVGDIFTGAVAGLCGIGLLVVCLYSSYSHGLGNPEDYKEMDSGNYRVLSQFSDYNKHYIAVVKDGDEAVIVYEVYKPLPANSVRLQVDVQPSGRRDLHPIFPENGQK